MIKNNKKAPIKSEHHKTSNLILKKYDEKIKYQYEIIDLIETAKEVSLNQLLCMIQEAKEEIGKARIVEKLEDILESRFGYV